MAKTTIIMTIAELAACPMFPLEKAIVYIYVAGRSVAYPGPPPVRDMTKSKLFIAKCARTIKAERKIGVIEGMMIDE